MENQNKKLFSPPVLLVLCILLIAGTYLSYFVAKKDRPAQNTIEQSKFITAGNEFKKFESEAEFKRFLQKAQTGGAGIGSLTTATREMNAVDVAQDKAAFGMAAPMAMTSERASSTNIQVMGVDEPDIVKNDANTIYYSQQGFFYARPVPLMLESKMIAPDQPVSQKTSIINAFPPSALERIATIDKNGQLLLSDKTLIVQSGQTVYGYDVTDKKNPKEKWKVDLNNNAYMTSSRLYKGSLYMVVQTAINPGKPCPFYPISIAGDQIAIPCTDIYHPGASVNTDTTFTAIKINPETGEKQQTLSFIGSANGSTLYMSENAMYIATTQEPDILTFLSRFAEEKATDIIPADTRERIKKLQGYDISYAAKMTELSQIMQTAFNGESSDEQLKKQTEIENRLKEFSNAHKRELYSTQIVKINSSNLTQEAMGTIPGSVLNQFSLDEYEGNLRVAVTVGGFAWMTSAESANDVYILSKDLKLRGKIEDLGKQERIYSARFIGDTGYVVTFKQIDPFYVLDLSNPDSPQMKGELKIPGFSSYLHPLKNNLIVGIGREDGNAKVSLFDVSNPQNPTEVSKYTLKDYTSEILETHHAFLNDSKHEIMFIPGTSDGYVLSYKSNELKLEKAIADINPSRALYMDDYLYIIGSTEIVVYNENTWEEVKRLKLENE